MVVELVRALAVFLIEPMRGDTILRRAMHIARADLDFVELATRPEHGGMERLVPVRLGACDVVLDPLLQRCPGVMNDAEHVIAVGDAVDEHADREEIVNLFERLAALLHFLEDRPEILGPAHDVPAHDPRTPQLVRQRDTHPLDRAVALDLARFHLARQYLVLFRLEILECQILELRFDAGHTEAMRQRGVQLPRLERDALALVWRQRIERAHVVQSVGKLDDDDARIARHRHQQLAVVLGLLFGGRAKGQGLDLGQAVDQVRDFAAEVAAQLLERDVGVFDHVVQERSRDGRGVHLLLGENGGHRDAVRDEVVARHALLTLMRLRAYLIGARQHVEVQSISLGRDRFRQLRGQYRRTRHNRPASAKLRYRSLPPPTIT